MYSILMDLDGTLTKDNGTIDSQDLNTLNQILEHNRMCIVSSSNYSSLQNFKNKYGLNCDIFSTTAGIADINGEVIYNTIPHIAINSLFKDFREYIYTAWSEAVDRTYIYKYKERLELMYPPKRRVHVLERLEDDLPAFTVVIDAKIANDFRNKMDDIGMSYRILAADRNREILNICHDSMSKSDAYYLMAHTYPENKKIIGVSDSYYDYDMIAKCDIKIAMLNADDKLKTACDYITESDNNQGGAIKLLNNICHLQ